MTAESLSDEELLSAARAGDRQALETLLLRHQGQVYRYGMKMCRDPEDAKDVLQDTLFAMARGVRDFRGASSLSTWLYTIARSFCIKKRRRSKFAPEQERSLDTAAAEAKRLPAPARAPDEELAGRRVEQALDQAIAALDPKSREVLLLRDVEGLTATEVAEVLRVNVPAVKSRLHRARLAVRESVAPLLGADVQSVPGACPDVAMLLSQHLEDEISSDRCAEMERHLETCARCRGTCDSLRRTLALCKTTGASIAVPTAVQAEVRAAIEHILAGQGRILSAAAGSDPNRRR